MSDTRRNELTRALSDIDQLLAAAENLAELPIDDGVRDSVLDTLIEFQEVRRNVEAELRSE